MDVKDIINYRKLSEFLGLHPESIRKNKSAAKHKAKIDKLYLTLKVWQADIEQEETNQTKKK